MWPCAKPFNGRSAPTPCVVCGCVCIGYNRAQLDRCWRHEPGKTEQSTLGLA
jgi:hypothetical protein